MARKTTTPSRQQPRLYLLAHLTDSALAALAADITRLAEPLDIAALLLRPSSEMRQPSAFRPVVAACRAAGIACLIEGDVALASAIEADGAHLEDTDALKAALPALRPEGIAGVGGLKSKHDAMTAGELGADYVMFGEPDAAGRRGSFETTLERTDWWAQLFEPPCVAYARTLEEVEALVEAGADFIAVDTLALDATNEQLEELVARLGSGEAER